VQIGLQAIGIGTGARPAVLRETARAAEAAGFATLWAGEHVVLFDRAGSRYPYAEEGEFPVDAATDWLDPFTALAWAGAVTSTIGLATGICLVPEHNPLILAKQIASLDVLTSGRFSLGVGVGWMAEEFAALGVPFERRAARTREYVTIMRRLWNQEMASFAGEFVRFDNVRCFPKPLRGAVAILVGGESRAALTRSAEYGDGWYGFNLSAEEAAERLALLDGLLALRHRDRTAFRVVVAPFTKPVGPADLERYRALGVDELVVVAAPPAREEQVAAWVAELAAHWGIRG